MQAALLLGMLMANSVSKTCQKLSVFLIDLVNEN